MSNDDMLRHYSAALDEIYRPYADLSVGYAQGLLRAAGGRCPGVADPWRVGSATVTGCDGPTGRHTPRASHGGMITDGTLRT